MPPVKRINDPLVPEGCYGGIVWTGGSGNVMANSIPVVRLGDPTSVHCCGPSCHSSAASAGSGKVFANGKPVIRTGDPAGCGATASTGSGNVFAN